MHVYPPRRLLHPAALALYRVLRAGVSLQVRDAHDVLARDGAAIFACRHGELLPLLFAMEGRGLAILVSQSRDGELLASILERRGFALLRGSSSQDGFSAARAVLAWLAGGRSLGLAVDGPRGPRGEVQHGVLRLAQRSGVPIVPLRLSPGRRFVVPQSWDRFEFPLPGTRCSVLVGAPLHLAAGEAGLRSGGRRLAQALGGSYGERVEIAALAPGLSGYGNP
jgi:lysophospholipid acyltransferase (LPLAT)-like uncharacterized protein